MALLRNLQFLFHGSRHFGKEGWERASKSFDSSVMSSRLDGKLCLVTGANQGLGLQTSKELASRGAKLYMVCRNAARGKEAVEAVRAETGNADVHLKVCDVSSLQAVADLAKQVTSEGVPLHCLVNNAGVMVHERTQSADGYDINFATNVLGGWVLTLLLEQALKAGAPGSRVIFVSSGGMLTEKLEVDDLNNERMGSSYDGTKAYAKDKRRQVVIAERLDAMWGSAGVKVVSCHPGWTTTEGVKKSIPGFYNFYKDKFRDLPQGADTIVFLALQDAAKLEGGAFYGDRAVQAKHLSMGFTSYSKADVDKLWANMEKMAEKVLKK